MARPPKDVAAAKALGKALTALHAKHQKRHGPISFDRLARRIEIDQGIAVSGEQVRKYHRGEIDPNVAAVDDLIGLVKFYGVTPAKLGTVAETRINRVRDLVVSGFGWLLASPVAA